MPQFDTTKACYALFVISATILVFWWLVPHLVKRSLRKRKMRQSEQMYVYRVLVGLFIALQVTILGDMAIHLSGGPAIVAPLEIDVDERAVPEHWVALRDGMAANLMFFLTAGLIAALASWSRPEEEAISQRVHIMFPRLSSLDTKVDAFTKLATELAVLTESIELDITIEEYDASIDAFKLHVRRRETFVNLFVKEGYVCDSFKVSISTDKVGPAGGLVGCLYAVNFVQLDAKGVCVAKARYLPRRKLELTPADPHWSSPGEKLSIPAEGKGIWKLDYWYWNKCGMPYFSSSRRPTLAWKMHITNQLDMPVEFAVRVDGNDEITGEVKPGAKEQKTLPPGGARPNFELALMRQPSEKAAAPPGRLSRNAPPERQS